MLLPLVMQGTKKFILKGYPSLNTSNLQKRKRKKKRTSAEMTLKFWTALGENFILGYNAI
jgi:hypothetical protein